MESFYLDWTIIGLMVFALLAATIYSKRYMRGVADFLAADRMAGRYLLTVAGGFYGAVSLVAIWEMIYASGLPPQWWQMMNLPIGLFLGLTGFIVYRFRQTRALTLAQFFEERYSRKFRYYAGALCWVSGVLNFGVFPLVSGNLMVYFFGLPRSFMLGSLQIQTLWVVMFCYLALATYIACSGGQITIMITDFLQGAMLMLIFAIVIICLLNKYNWSDIMQGMTYGVPEGTSLINPFTGSSNNSFDIWYFIICLFGAIYNARSWQGNSGYNSAAKTPHEAVIAGVIGNWRMMVSSICIVLIPLVAYTVLHSPKFVATAEPINGVLNSIADVTTRTQMTVPVVLRYVLLEIGPGLVGLFAAVIVGCAVSCDDTYMHAWGTIFVQDVVLPIRKKPFKSPKTHLLILRISIVAVALFGFIFSILFPMKGYILMFFALTGAIYLGGAGAVIIGGLYWKRGTTAAAWTALTIGTIVGFGGICIQQMWDMIAPRLIELFPAWDYLKTIQNEFPINGQWIYFGAMLLSSFAYVAVSLLGPKVVFNMDRLLHRGKYAIDADIVNGDEKIEKMSFKKLLGITSEFSRFERLLFYGTFAWLMGWWGIFIVGVVVNIFHPLSDQVWSIFWYSYVVMWVVLGILCTVWIFAGGIRDAFRMFRDLRTTRDDVKDDGFVRD